MQSPGIDHHHKLQINLIIQDIFRLKSSFILITGNFNCINSNWYLGDPVTSKRARLEAFTSFQISACIDVVFTNQRHLVIESDVHSSLRSTCHHEIVFVKLSQKVEYPPYERVFWDCSRADNASVNQAMILQIGRNFLQINLESQVSEMNDLLLNIYSNYFPKKTFM